jgi:hypothetical protein
MSAMIIEYATTDDNFNGSPWMPDGADYCAIVGRDRGHTKWRRITAAKYYVTSEQPWPYDLGS